MRTPATAASDQEVPTRQVRAVFDDRNVVVYQAYSAVIAEPAVATGHFVPPFNLHRMTWIKPSFLWMMYRCGWATKPGQEHVLAITITRDGFEWALAHSCLSHHDPEVYGSHAQWSERKEATPVRIQWDPERSLLLEPLSHRAIQIGLSGDVAQRFVNDWTVAIDDVTAITREIRKLIEGGDLTTAKKNLPAERPYPLPKSLKAIIGAT